jgi:general secretion pathway protein A
MYCDFYQLTERPFNVTPDPKFLYLNARYREAIASLNYGITQRKGFITLIGEAGTGKTTLLKRLLEDLDAKTKSEFIFNTNVSFEEILEYIFAEFDLPVHNGKKLYMLQRLNSFLLEELRGGSNVALLIDEAQDLEFSVLEDLRLLSNLETAKEKILQIVLSGQPELGQKLSNPVLRQLRQRIGINCRLLPLSRDEITEYIQFRLQAAGCPDLKLFSRDAEDQIYHFSHGIPRLVNVVCDNALVIGYALGKKRIGADLITEAAADLLSVEPAVEEAAEPRPAAPAPSAPVTSSRWRARLGVLGLVLLATVVGLLSVGRTMLHKRGDDQAAAPPRQTFEVIRPGSQQPGTGVDVPLARGSRNPSDASENEAAAPAPGTTNQKIAAAKRAVQPAEVGLPTSDMLAAAAVATPAAVGPEPATKMQEERSNGVPQTHPSVAQPEAPPVAEEHVGEEGLARGQDAERGMPPGRAVSAAPAKRSGQNAGDSLAKGTDMSAEADLATAHPQRTDVQPYESANAQRQDSNSMPAPLESSSEPRLDGVQFATQVVRIGDSMSNIALRKYGQATYTILDLLKLANPQLRDIDQIAVGQTIRLPELGEQFPVLDEGSGRYALLVFSTAHASRAGNLQKALRSRGFDAHVSEGSVGFRKPVFRVVVPGFADRDEVAAVSKQLQKLFREDTQIAQLGE